MSRSSVTSGFFLAWLVFIASDGCSASMPSSLAGSPQDLVDSASPQVAHGSVDKDNVLLPAVAIITYVPYPGGFGDHRCSGVLVAPDMVITAAHCVCAPRAPTPQDKLLLDEMLEPLSDAGTTQLTEVWDRSSSCATKSFVTTLVYGKPGDREPWKPGSYLGRVVIHPEFRLFVGLKNGKEWTFWNRADLAALYLDRPATVAPIGLPSSEVNVGDALVMGGYGPTENGDRESAGPRRVGNNVATRFVRLGNGSLLIAAGDQPGPDGGVPAHTRKSDSGGPLVRKDAPNVLVGISTLGGVSATGSETSFFTSAFEYVGWISERIEQGPPADAGVSAPQSDAGVGIRDSDAGSTRSVPPSGR